MLCWFLQHWERLNLLSIFSSWHTYAYTVQSKEEVKIDPPVAKKTVTSSWKKLLFKLIYKIKSTFVHNLKQKNSFLSEQGVKMDASVAEKIVIFGWY